MGDILIKNIDKETKLKASFVLKSKGKSLTQGIKEYLNEQAEEFNKMKGE